MPAAIATQVLVNEAAAALAAAGEEPTILSVQRQIGAGSYTTIKRMLDVWQAEQVNTPPPAIVPDAVVARGAEFTRILWAQATALAEEHTRQAREEAVQQTQQARGALAEAEATIARIEGENEAQGQELITALRAVDHLEKDFALEQGARQAAEARASEVERRSAELRGELEQARAAERGLARVEGERDALRRQVAEQQAMIERLGKHE